MPIPMPMNEVSIDRPAAGWLESPIRRRLGATGLAVGAACVLGAVLAFAPPPVLAQDAGEAPEALIKRVANEILDRIKADPAVKSGDLQEINKLVDELLMPHVDFKRMTSLAAGRWWRQATPEQQQQLMSEFRTLLIRTYAGALASVGNQSIRMKPMRGSNDPDDTIVRTEVVQPGAEPAQVDYRLEKKSGEWKVYDVNVLGVWLVQTYRNQFAQEATRSGVEGLIRSLAEKNQQFASPARQS